MIKLSNDIYIHFALEKEIGNSVILKNHAETLRSILLSIPTFHRAPLAETFLLKF